MKLRGYAIPWDVPVVLDGLTETVAPGAIRIDSPLNIKLQLLTHDNDAKPIASTAYKTLTLFHDDYGLGFEADLTKLSPTAFGPAEILSVANDVNQCSVRFTEGTMMGSDDTELRAVRIKSARIDHITITARAVYGDHTAAWLVDENNDQPGDELYLPRRVRDHARHWNHSEHRLRGHIILERERAERAAAAKAMAPSATSARSSRSLASISNHFDVDDGSASAASWSAWWASTGRQRAQAAARK